MTIGERIKKVRKENNLTQQTFAEKLGNTQNTIARYETDRVTPSSSAVTLICKTYNIREEWLRTGDGEMHARQEAISLNDPTLDNMDKSILQSYLKMPPVRRAFFKEWIGELSAAFAQSLRPEAAPPDAPPTPEEFTPEELAIYERVRKSKEAFVKKESTTSRPGEADAG